MISINLKPTARTSIYPVRQGHLLPMSTCTTVLRSVCRVNSNQSPASIYRFVGEKLSKLRPRSINNTFSKTVIMNHSVDFKVLDGDHSEAVDDLLALLVSEVSSSVGDSLVDLRNNLASLFPFWGAFLGIRELTLLSTQIFLVSPEKLGSKNGFSSRKHSKRDQAHVNADNFIRIGQGRSFHLTGEANEPLAGRASLDRAGLLNAFDRAVEDNSDLPYLGELEHVTFELPSDTSLRVSEGVIAVVSLEPRITGFLPGLHSAEECFESQVKSDGYVLEDLRMDISKRRALSFQARKGICLRVIIERFFSLLPGNLSLLQKIVVKPAALIKSVLHQSLLFLGWFESVLKCFKHGRYFSLISHACQVGNAIHPLPKGRGFLVRFDRLDLYYTK